LDYENLIAKIKDENDFPGLKIDLLRVLIVNIGSRWKSDLLKDISMFRKVLNRKKEFGKEEINRALKDLQARGLIGLEDRPKATRDGSKPDVLISLKDPVEIREVFKDDEVLMEYRRETGWAKDTEDL